MTQEANGYFNSTWCAGLTLLLTTQVLYAQQVPRDFSDGAQAARQPMPNWTRSQPVQSQALQLQTRQPQPLHQPPAHQVAQGSVRPATYSETSDAPQVATIRTDSNQAAPRQSARLATADRSDQNARTRIVRTISSIGVVGGLMMGFIWWTRKNQSESTYVPASELVEVVGRVALDAKHKAHIVRFGDRLLLLSLDGSGVSKLGEIGTGEIGADETERHSSTGAAALQRRVSSI